MRSPGEIRNAWALVYARFTDGEIWAWAAESENTTAAARITPFAIHLVGYGIARPPFAKAGSRKSHARDTTRMSPRVSRHGRSNCGCVCAKSTKAIRRVTYWQLPCRGAERVFFSLSPLKKHGSVESFIPAPKGFIRCCSLCSLRMPLDEAREDFLRDREKRHNR